MARRDENRRRTFALAAVVIALTAAACTGSDDQPDATVAATTTTSAPEPRDDDGILRVGVLIPRSDPAISTNLETAVQRAVGEVNAAGGVLGGQVELVTADEGSTAASAVQATELLIESGADAIVGPTSSNVAIAVLDEAVGAGIVTCSATATAMSLDDYPDGRLFFRSIAPDSLQAAAIARDVAGRGAGRVAILHVDDAYGRPYAQTVADELDTQAAVQVSTVAVPFDDDDLTDDLDQLADIAADLGIVLGNGDDIARFLGAIAERDDIDLDPIVVNDAARSPAARLVIAGLDADMRSRIVGITPQIVLPSTGATPSTEPDPDDPESIAEVDTPFSSQVTECIDLISLSAVQGGSDSPSVIASQMSSVSSGGFRCRSFADCSAQLENGVEIDYDGPTRITELARDGDPSRAFFDKFGFDEDGADVYERSVAVS